MIIIESKRKKEATLHKQYPGIGKDTYIIDVTSRGKDPWCRMSPFYPHGGIPVPFSDGYTATCVEAIWQGLKVFEGSDVDVALFKNDTMKNIKRTVRTNGVPLGHRKGVHGTELLSYIEARKQIYLPTYKWMLEHCVPDLVTRLREGSSQYTILLLDYDTNAELLNPNKPLSHASLVKAYVDGCYPNED